MSFNEALDDAIRQRPMGGAAAEPFRTPTFSLGQPLVDLDRALQVSAEIEDYELVNRDGSATPA